MSEIHEELLGRGVSTKRIIGVIAVVGLLLGVFVFQTTIFSVIFSTEKQDANEKLEDAPIEDPELVFVLGNLDFDFDISLLETEIFRIYDYVNFSSMSSVLWKNEVLDQYNGETWTTSVFPSLTSFADYTVYYSDHQPAGADLITLQQAVTPSVGSNQIDTYNIFSDPLIMEDSVSSANTSNLNVPLTTLYKNEFNASILDLTFTSTDSALIEYELYGIPGVPDDDTINNSAVDEFFTPAAIKTKYLQLPPSIASYQSNNYYFNQTYLELTNIIEGSDHAFEVANKIRNYLQDNFSIDFTGSTYLTDGPSEGEDEIEWFCEKETGLPFHFAATFTALCRSFGVASRLVDGYNSRFIVEENDIYGNFFAIKYKNMYHWAEVYIPTEEISGNGNWVEMDILFESFGGGFPIVEGIFNLTITIDNSTINFQRGEYARITATLNSSDSSVENKMIEFRDYATDQLLGQTLTDANGNATIYIEMDSGLLVGRHIIYAQFQTAFNYTSL